MVLGLLVACSVLGWAADQQIYQLQAVKNTTNTDYNRTYDVTINEMIWNAPGNQSTDGGWRIGGKSITNVSRVITGKTAMSNAATKLILTHTGRSRNTVTVSSIKLTVAADASFSTVRDEVTVTNPDVATSGSVIIVPTSSVSVWAKNSYYKITFVVSNSSTSNGGLDFTGATWYVGSGVEEPEEPETPITPDPQATLPSKINHAMPALGAFYDFLGNGHKGMVAPIYGTTKHGSSTYETYQLATTGDYTTHFQVLKSLTEPFEYSYFYNGEQEKGVFVDDINEDGNMDVGGWRVSSSFEYFQSFTSSGNGYTASDRNVLYIPNCDLNKDGRPDYLRCEKYKCGVYTSPTAYQELYAYRWYVNYLQPNGTYREELLDLMTRSDYNSSFNTNVWNDYLADLGDNTLLPAVNRTSYAVSTITTLWPISGKYCDELSGADNLATPPFFPTMVVDVNADGWPDLVDENNGGIWFQMEKGRWIRANAFTPIRARDMNKDNTVDFVYTDPNSHYAIMLMSMTSGGYQKSTLQSKAVDDNIIVRDFNKDGHPDILITVSHNRSANETSSSILHLNNGNGTFTAQTEQTYGTNRLLFKECQDIDGDGYYDLLAFGLDTENKTNGKVYQLKGTASYTFNSPQLLYTITYEDVYTHEQAEVEHLKDFCINVADLDDDGKQEIWVSRPYTKEYTATTPTTIHSMSSGSVNVAPSAPAMPQLTYNDGVLKITWGDGADAKTSTADLTYALRIGTTSGGEEIMHSHALVDGTRRNFMDGNMGYKHEYTIDLRTYAPTQIYVAVQAIDAQHCGSEWSNENSVYHQMVSADFLLPQDEMRINETVSAIYTELPESYTHVWNVEDGQATPGSNSTVFFSFNQPGLKTITHLVQYGGQTLKQASAQIHVVPNGTAQPKDVGQIFTAWNMTVADYNFDGIYDQISGDKELLAGSADYVFTKVPGSWNKDLHPGDIWVDYDHNGAIDYLYDFNGNYYILEHDEGTGIRAVKMDNNLSAYMSYINVGTGIFVDLNHDGYYEAVCQDSEGGTCVQVHQGDGTFATIPVTCSSGKYVVRNCLYTGRKVDMDHDGFVDAAFVRSTATDQPYTELAVLMNQGGYNFQQKSITFEKSIAYNSTYFEKLLDFNADGYIDLLCMDKKSGELFILWNKNNRTYSAPYKLPMGKLAQFVSPEANFCYMVYEDLNNDGYPDILSFQYSAVATKTVGLYAWYMGPEGVTEQGFVALEVGYDGLGSSNYHQLFRVRDHLDFYDDITKTVHTIVGAQNEAPAAPSNVRTTVTRSGMLIEWDDASDDHTVASLMRYNLSVKRAGKSGAGAYLISPQNGGNAQAAPLPNWDYVYINATRFFIPRSALTDQNYEISLQAIDLWDAASEFSLPITADANDYDPHEDIDEVMETPAVPVKVLIDNVIYILRGDKIYTLQGQEVR